MQYQTGKGGNTKEQMASDRRKDNTMTMQSERMKNDNKVAGMMGYLFYPGSSGRSKNDGGYAPYDAYIVSEHGTGIMIFM